MSATALQVLLSGVRGARPTHASDVPVPEHPTVASCRSERPAFSGARASTSSGRLPQALDFFAHASDQRRSTQENQKRAPTLAHSGSRTNGGTSPLDKIDAVGKGKRKRKRSVPGSNAAEAQPSGLDQQTTDMPQATSNPIATPDDPHGLMPLLAARLHGHSKVASGLFAMGAGVPTQVQERAMAFILGCSDGSTDAQMGSKSGEEHGVSGPRDLIAIAPTGSGKTLCYAAPLCASVDFMRKELMSTGAGGKTKSTPTCLVLVPTRELAVQVAAVFERLAEASRLKLAVKVLASKAALSGLRGAKVDVAVATPQRCTVALERRLFDLSGIKHVVLDEADRLLDDGFIGQVDAVLAECGRERRLHSFSATMPPVTEEIIRGLCKDPVKVVVGGGSYGGSAAIMDIARSITQRFKFVGGRGEQGKVLAVREMLKEGLMPPVLVFVQSKERAADLFRELIFDGVNVDAIHADRSGAARSSAIARFRSGELAVLIATDLLSRGLDFKAVATVINYDFPTSAASYVHRIGRTGRNGRHGTALTLFTEEDAGLVGAVARVALASGCSADEVPEWMVHLGSGRRGRDEARRLEQQPPKRQRVGGPSLAKLPKRSRGRARVPGGRTPSEDADKDKRNGKEDDSDGNEECEGEEDDE